MSKVYIWALLVLAVWSCGRGISPREHTKAGASCTGKPINVAFYNVENLFDIRNDSITADDDFTPEGKQAWDETRYQAKLEAIASVIDTLPGSLPALLGLCEVENVGVIQQLLTTGTLAQVPYGIVHKESPDERGIDVALIYRQDMATLVAADWLTVTLPDPDDRTRDILYASFLIGGEEMAVYVNHWPSRSGGQEKSEPARLAAARTLISHWLSNRQSADKPVLVMGDFNDYPDDRSLQALATETQMTNLMGLPAMEGLGSYNYRGEWGFLDQILVSSGLMDGRGLDIKDGSAQALKEGFMLYTNPETGEQRPNRTFGGTQYFGGYSDHLPVHVVLQCTP